MKRVIVKRYDETNMCWRIRYYQVYPNALTVQEFQTPVLNGREYVGMKRQTRAREWFGRMFLQEALDTFRVLEHDDNETGSALPEFLIALGILYFILGYALSWVGIHLPVVYPLVEWLHRVIH